VEDGVESQEGSRDGKGGCMTVKFYASTGYVGSKKVEEVEIDIEDLEGLNQLEIDNYMQDILNDIMCNLVELGWEDVTPEMVAEELEKEGV
jgi:hypothetical protein